MPHLEEFGRGVCRLLLGSNYASEIGLALTELSNRNRRSGREELKGQKPEGHHGLRAHLP